jgi:hypothetical protein
MQRKQQGMMPGMPGQMQIQMGPAGALHNAQQQPSSAQFDSDYASLMAELGEMPVGGDPQANGGQGPVPTGSIPPWRIPSNWCVRRRDLSRDTLLIVRSHRHPPQAPNTRPSSGYVNYSMGYAMPVQSTGVGSLS